MGVGYCVAFSEETGVKRHEGREEDDGEENAVEEDGEGEKSVGYADPEEGEVAEENEDDEEVALDDRTSADQQGNEKGGAGVIGEYVSTVGGEGEGNLEKEVQDARYTIVHKITAQQTRKQ